MTDALTIELMNGETSMRGHESKARMHLRHAQERAGVLVNVNAHIVKHGIVRRVL